MRLLLVGEITLLWEAIDQAIKARGLGWRVETATPNLALLAARQQVKADVVMVQASANRNLNQVLPFVNQGARVIVVGLDGVSEESFLPALNQGAMGFLDYTASIEEALTCIRQVAEGEMHIPARMAARLANEYRGLARSQSSGELTQRELEILSQLAKGHSNREIATALYLSEHTVRAHLRSIMHKLNVENRVQAVARATTDGLLAAEPARVLVPAQTA